MGLTTRQSDVVGTVDDDASVQDAIGPLAKVEAGVVVAASGQPLWGAWKVSKFAGQVLRKAGNGGRNIIR